MKKKTYKNPLNTISIVYNFNCLQELFLLERETAWYLDIVFNEKLSWVDHTEFVRKKVNQRLGVLRRVKHFLPFYVRNLFVNTIVLPFLDYCGIVWGDRNNKLLVDSLQVLQNRAAKIALFTLLPLKRSWILRGKNFVLEGAFIGLFMFWNV